MKWPAKLFPVIAVLVGIYYGASGEDRERWMAALKLSTTSAAKLRMENERQKYLAAKAAEQARWRGAAQTENDTVLAANTMLNSQETCAGMRSREGQMRSEGREPDRDLERTILLCARVHVGE